MNLPLMRAPGILAIALIIMSTVASPARAADPLPRANLLGGVFSAVQGKLCPVTTSLPVAGPAVCNLDLLHVRFATRFKRSDGTILSRTYGGTLFVPTLLDVNGDGLSDVIATASIASLNSAKLSIVRLPTALGPLPAAVEAIIADPTKGSLPRKVIAYGEDALAGQLPTSFDSTVTFGSIASEPGGVQLDIQNRVRGPGSSLDVVAGLFDGTPQARINEMGGSLRYTPVPATFGAAIRMGRRFSGTLTTASPTTLGLGFSTTEGAAVQRFDGTIDKLPANASVSYEKVGEDQRTVTFTGSAPIAKVDGTYRSGTKNSAGVLAVAEHAEAQVTAMPTKLSVRQTSAKQVTLSTEGSGSIGRVRVGLANGVPRFLDTQESYARTFEGGGLKSIAAQVNGLRTASFDGREKIILDATFAPVAPALSGFRILADDGARHVDGHVDDVPDHITATFDLEGGVIGYDGHGQTVHAIDLDATRTSPFFERATHIHGGVRDLPPNVTLNFKPGATSADFRASAPIGEVDLVASQGPAAGIPGTGAGALFVDRPDAFVVAGRIKGLKRVLLQGGATYETEIEIAPGDFSLGYDDGTRVLDGNIKGLPGKLSGTYDPATGAEYHADAVIGEIRLDLVSSVPFVDRLRSASTTLTGVPKDVVVTSSPAGGGDPGSICRDICNASTGFRLTASPAITQIDAAVSSTATTPRVPGTDSGVLATSTPAELSAAVRVKGIEEVTVKGEPVAVKVKATESQRFTIAATYNKPGDPFGQDTSVEGFIENIPTTVDVSMVGKVMHYKAANPIDRIFLHARALPDTVREAKVDIRAVPTELYVYTGKDNAGGSDVYGVDGLGSRIGQIDLNVSDFTLLPDLTGTTNQVALNTYESVPDPDGVIKLRARIFGLRKAVLRKGPEGEQIVDVGFNEAGPPVIGRSAATTRVAGPGLPGVGDPAATSRALTLDIRGGEGLSPIQTDVSIPTVPASLVATLATNFKTLIKVDASAPIGAIDADVRVGPDGFSLGTPHEKSIFTSRLRNVPSELSFCLTEIYPRCGSIFPVINGSARQVPFAVDIESNGPAAGQPGALTVDARLCLGRLAAAAGGGGSPLYTPANCRKNEHALKYLDLNDVELKEFHFEMQSGGDQTAVAIDSDGDGVRERAGDGVIIGRLRYVDTGIPTDIDGLQLLQPTDPIVFDNFAFLLDTSAPPSLDVFGSLSCPASTVANLINREAGTGAIRLVSVPFLDLDFSGSLGC